MSCHVRSCRLAVIWKVVTSADTCQLSVLTVTANAHSLLQNQREKGSCGQGRAVNLVVLPSGQTVTSTPVETGLILVIAWAPTVWAWRS